ncbi:MAG: BON domain-containing protein [Chitinophagaceae bacterium]
MKPILILLSIVTMLFIASCAGRTDKEIETDVSVSVHPTAPEITVSCKGGVVFLSGMVKDSANWRATIKAARAVSGVKSVDDKLHIANPK